MRIAYFDSADPKMDFDNPNPAAGSAVSDQRAVEPVLQPGLFAIVRVLADATMADADMTIGCSVEPAAQPIEAQPRRYNSSCHTFR